MRATIALVLAGAGTVAAQAQTVRLAGSDSTGPAVSADGRYVAYRTLDGLVAADTNGTYDIYVYDRTTGAVALASVDSSGVVGNDGSHFPAIASDGHAVAFASFATNLVAGDQNATIDVFVHDFGTGQTTCVSVTSGGATGNGMSIHSCIDAAGLVVAFDSDAKNLVTGDSNGCTDVFVRDLTTGTTTRASVDGKGNQGLGASHAPAISADGTRIAFGSVAQNLIPSDANRSIEDIYLRDTAAGTTELVSLDDQGLQALPGAWDPSISSDGSRVSFTAWNGVLPTQVNRGSDIILRDRAAATTTLVSVTDAGVDGDEASMKSRISGDGTVVAFVSAADDLVGSDSNHVIDTFVRDLRGGYSQRVSVDDHGMEGDRDSDYLGSLSLDDAGVVIAYSSWATNLDGFEVDGLPDVYVRTRAPLLAQSSNYGAGWAGSLGIPSLAAATPPAFSTDVVVHASTSATWWTLGFALVGANPASIPTNLGGTLLVDILAVIPIAVGPGGADFGGHLPDDTALYGGSAFLQVLELDAGASDGVSFTPGLELDFGR